MADIPYEKMRALPPGGGDNPVVNMVDSARRAVCDIYRSAPGQLVARGVGLDPTGVGSLSRKFFDNMCSDTGLPPAPSRPGPAGGQCAVDYNVVIVFNGGNGVVGPAVFRRRGPIGAPFITGDDFGFTRLAFTHGLTSGSTETVLSVFNQEGQEEQISRLAIISFDINPIAGPDNCGQLPPYDKPKNLPPEDFDKPVEWKDRDGPTSGPFRLPPQRWPSLPDGQPWRPEINVNIDDVNIVFDFDGATFFPIDVNVPIEIGKDKAGGGSNPLPTKPITNPIDPVAIADRFDRIEDLLEQLEDCACDEYTPTLVPTTGATLPSQCLSLSVSRNRFVAVNIVQAPSNASTYSGGSAPNVYQAGWAWFKAGDFLFERSPIDALGKVFQNPGGATAFCYTLKRGYDGFPITLDTPIE